MQQIPPTLTEFVNDLPTAETVRARIVENRREAAFLRRLLKLAVAAERTTASRKERNVNDQAAAADCP
jgi:hypothetical protein